MSYSLLNGMIAFSVCWSPGEFLTYCMDITFKGIGPVWEWRQMIARNVSGVDRVYCVDVTSCHRLFNLHKLVYWCPNRSQCGVGQLVREPDPACHSPFSSQLRGHP